VELYTALPLTFYFLLVELIVGSAVAMLLVEPRLEVGPGFLQFMGVSIVATLLLALWAGGGLPDPAGAPGLAAVGPTRPLYGALAAAALYTVFSFRPRRLPRIAAGSALVATSGLALSAGLAAYAPPGPAGPVLVSFAAASTALGASMTGMLLGHWYLVAPMLSSRPLIRLTALLLLALLAQAAIVVWLGGGSELQRFGPVVWIRAGFGILFPLVMAGFVWYSCQIRAMRTATGILYLAVGCVLMGDVAAKVIYFLTAVPV
jgi:hypothetical protein